MILRGKSNLLFLQKLKRRVFLLCHHIHGFISESRYHCPPYYWYTSGTEADQRPFKHLRHIPVIVLLYHKLYCQSHWENMTTFLIFTFVLYCIILTMHNIQYFLMHTCTFINYYKEFRPKNTNTNTVHLWTCTRSTLYFPYITTILNKLAQNEHRWVATNTPDFGDKSRPPSLKG
jgi:hypothetical protein